MTTLVRWYGWQIDLPLPEVQRSMLGPQVDEQTRTVHMLRSRVVLATEDEKRYLVANAAVKHLVERTTQPLQGVRHDPGAPPVVLYQDAAQEGGTPAVRYDRTRSVYVVRMALALNVKRIEYEGRQQASIGLSTQKLGDAAYRMDAPTFARSFSRLIQLGQLPVPMAGTQEVFPLHFPRAGVTAADPDKVRSWLLHAFRPDPRSSMDATTSRFSSRRLSLTPGWRRFTGRFGLWESYGLVYARTNVLLSSSSSEPASRFVPLAKVPRRREAMYVRTAGSAWKPDVGDMLEDHDFALVSSAAVETRPIPGKGLGNVATRPLLAGTLVEEYTGEVLALGERELHGKDVPHFEFAAEMESVVLESGRRLDLLVDAQDTGNVSRFFNHTCYPRGSHGQAHYMPPGPNADLLALWHADRAKTEERHHARRFSAGAPGRRRVMIIVMRDVREGEEITVNYGKNYEIDRCLCDVCK